MTISRPDAHTLAWMDPRAVFLLAGSWWRGVAPHSGLGRTQHRDLTRDKGGLHSTGSRVREVGWGPQSSADYPGVSHSSCTCRVLTGPCSPAWPC